MLSNMPNLDIKQLHYKDNTYPYTRRMHNHFSITALGKYYVRVFVKVVSAYNTFDRRNVGQQPFRHIRFGRVRVTHRDVV